MFQPPRQDLAVERVRHLDDGPGLGLDHLDEPAGLESLEVLGNAQPLGRGQRDLLGHGHRLEHVAAGGLQQAEALLDQLA